MNKAYIVKKIYKGRLAICCYFNEYSEDYFAIEYIEEEK